MGAVSTLGTTGDLSVHRAFCTFVGIKLRPALRGPGLQHYLVPVDGSEATHEALVLAESLLAPGDRLSLLYVRNPAEQPALIVPLRWTTVKARYENRGMVVFVVDVARGESKTSCLLHSVDVRPNFVVVGIGFELRLRNAADAECHYPSSKASAASTPFTPSLPPQNKGVLRSSRKGPPVSHPWTRALASLAKMVY